VQPRQCQVQGDDHLSTPAGHTLPDTSQDVFGLLGHLGTLLALVQLVVNQHLQILFCQAAFQPLFPKPVVLQKQQRQEQFKIQVTKPFRLMDLIIMVFNSTYITQAHLTTCLEFFFCWPMISKSWNKSLEIALH